MGRSAESGQIARVQSPRFAQAIKQRALCMQAGDTMRNAFLDEEELMAEERARRDIQEAVQKSVDVRLLPVTSLGFGHTDLSHKLSCLIHTLNLEIGTNAQEYYNSIVACVTDQGRPAVC